MSVISQIFGISPTAQVSGGRETSQTSADAKGQEALSKLSGGDTVDGKIADIKGNDVTIELPGGGTVSAKLDNAMALSKGQNVTFEVRNASGGQVSLTPLYTNMNLSATAQKALQAAGMSVTADTLKMTMSMMDEGLSIDKNSLGDMYNRILSNSDADIRNLVEMSRMGLEINDLSIEQYSAFKTYENQISDGMREIADSTVSLYEELKASGDDAQAMQFLKELTDIITKGSIAEQTGNVTDPGTTASPETGNAAIPGSVNGGAVEAAVLNGADGGVAAGAENAVSAQANVPEALFSELEQAFSEALESKGASGEEAAGAKVVLKEASAESVKAAAQGEVLRAGEDTAVKDAVKTDHTEAVNAAGKDLLDAVPQTDSAASRMQTAMVRAAVSGGDTALAAKLADLTPTDQNMLKAANAVLKSLEGGAKNEALAEKLRQILDSGDFKEVVKNAMKENWTIRPEQVSDKANVENLYQRLNAQTKELTQMLTQIAKPESAMAQNLGNMSNNLDFMNQMNQMYQYVQLPLKMNGSEATGDLFVYSDKKSLASGDGSVSALLHLDMKYLGALDVYAAIAQGNKVSTRFYLESDEMIDFIAEHIHILNEHLEARGYSVKADITRHEDASDDGTEEAKRVRQLKETVGKSMLSKQSFDVRA